MHELSIALSIVDAVTQHAQHRGAGRVAAVHVKVGPLSGVVSTALRLAYDLACEGSALKGSILVIEDVAVTVHCPRCKGDGPVMSIQDMRCAMCGTPTPDIVTGAELEIVAMELVDEHATAPGGGSSEGAQGK